jgi:hypothetical protein
LKKKFDHALNNRIEFKYKEAFKEFDEIINAFSGLNIALLTPNEIKLLVGAYCWKADILRLGSLEDQRMALTLLDKALVADPTYSEAQQLKKILEFELNFPV